MNYESSVIQVPKIQNAGSGVEQLPIRRVMTGFGDSIVIIMGPYAKKSITLQTIHNGISLYYSHTHIRQSISLGWNTKRRYYNQFFSHHRIKESPLRQINVSQIVRYTGRVLDQKWARWSRVCGGIVTRGVSIVGVTRVTRTHTRKPSLSSLCDVRAFKDKGFLPLAFLEASCDVREKLPRLLCLILFKNVLFRSIGFFPEKILNRFCLTSF